MKTFDSEIKKHTGKIRLSSVERRELRERIHSYMEYHPLPKQEGVLSGAYSSDTFTLFNFTSWPLRAVSGVFVLLVIVVPFIAEKSVPGDVLYLVKTNVNESFQSTLKTSPYEKIEFETRLMEKRIAEARVLADEGRLTPEVETRIAKTVKDHSVAVQDSIAELRATDAEGAAIAQIAYSSSLEVQSAMLGTRNAPAEEGVMMMTMMAKAAPAVDPILSVVNEAQAVIASGDGSTTPSFDGLMARTERETTRAYELFAQVKKTATEGEKNDIDRRLSDIGRLVEEAKMKRSEDEALAVENLIGTLKQIKKLVLFMTNINVRETVSLETIVPVVLSDAERFDIAKTDYEALLVDRETITARLAEVTDETVANQVKDGLVLVDDLLTNASSTMDVAEVTAFETAVRDARVWTNDLLMILDMHFAPAPEIIIEEVPAEEVSTTTEPMEETTIEV